jgi:hypothetical protein
MTLAFQSLGSILLGYGLVFGLTGLYALYTVRRGSTSPAAPGEDKPDLSPHAHRAHRPGPRTRPRAAPGRGPSCSASSSPPPPSSCSRACRTVAFCNAARSASGRLHARQALPRPGHGGAGSLERIAADTDFDITYGGATIRSTTRAAGRHLQGGPARRGRGPHELDGSFAGAAAAFQAEARAANPGRVPDGAP